MFEKVILSSYSNSNYKSANILKMFIWYFINELFFKNSLNPFSRVKIFFLRIFGAKVGRGVIIKQGVNIKYPWFLEIGNDVWVGENVWIDNLANVIIGNNVCISQGAMLLCGNHDYKKSSFDLIVKAIKLEEGAWVGAKSIVCQGVTMNSHSILTVGSVLTIDASPYSVYKGNPCVKVKDRVIKF